MAKKELRMAAEIRNPANFLNDAEVIDIWDGCSADADMGLGFSCAPRNASEASEINSRTASTDISARQNNSRPRNP
jgi:hypothetical protein